jgi:hypothetical protein
MANCLFRRGTLTAPSRGAGECVRRKSLAHVASEQMSSGPAEHSVTGGAC